LDLLIFLSSKYWQNVSRDKVARKWSLLGRRLQLVPRLIAVHVTICMLWCLHTGTALILIGPTASLNTGQRTVSNYIYLNTWQMIRANLNLLCCIFRSLGMVFTEQ
jgi:hypothetical protein